VDITEKLFHSTMPLITESESRPVGSYADTGIEVLIVGTGLAGLTASIECIRKGHKVRVLERNDDINTAGKCSMGPQDVGERPH
jgi:ribulose 1,5-bisphosphate synthetase/thiazole synthase